VGAINTGGWHCCCSIGGSSRRAVNSVWLMALHIFAKLQWPTRSICFEGQQQFCARCMWCCITYVSLVLVICREFTLNMISDWFVEVSCTARPHAATSMLCAVPACRCMH
jgi:hypothetical protein